MRDTTNLIPTMKVRLDRHRCAGPRKLDTYTLMKLGIDLYERMHAETDPERKARLRRLGESAFAQARYLTPIWRNANAIVSVDWAVA